MWAFAYTVGMGLSLTSSDLQSALWAKIAGELGRKRLALLERLASERDQLVAAEIRGAASVLKQLIETEPSEQPAVGALLDGYYATPHSGDVTGGSDLK